MDLSNIHVMTWTSSSFACTAQKGYPFAWGWYGWGPSCFLEIHKEWFFREWTRPFDESLVVLSSRSGSLPQSGPVSRSRQLKRGEFSKKKTPNVWVEPHPLVRAAALGAWHQMGQGLSEPRQQLDFWAAVPGLPSPPPPALQISKQKRGALKNAFLKRVQKGSGKVKLGCQQCVCVRAREGERPCLAASGQQAWKLLAI